MKAKAISKAVVLTATFATLIAISCSSNKNDDDEVSSSSMAVSSSSSIVSSSSSLSSSGSVLASSSSSSSSSIAASSSSSRTQAACTATRTQNNVKYIPDGTSGQHARHVLDLSLPDGNGPFPLVIFLHGGGFSGGSKADVTSTASAPNTAKPKGYAVASIGYRLSDATKFPGSFNDILTAIRFLRANAEQFCLDPDKFAVTGFSAGAYHAGMVCVLSGAANHDLDGFSNLYPGVSNKVQACVTYAALTDMRYLEDDEKQNPGINYMMTNHGGTSPEAVFLGINQALKDLPENPGDIRWRANPLNYVTTNTPPLMMIHATNDNVVPWQQSERLVNKVNSVVQGRAVFDKQTTGNHSGFPGRANDIYKFLDENLK